jgi:colicin import membrane protein
LARKLKSYQTSIGFYDMAVAAPSKKAALEAWGSGSNLFAHGLAKEADDPAVVAATMARPGVVLKRPVGSNGPFKEHAALPKALLERASDKPSTKPKQPAPATDDKAERKKAIAFEKELERRQEQRRIEEAEAEKRRKRREQATAKAEAALAKAKARHDDTVQEIDRERTALDAKSRAEDARWEKERLRLEAALREARGG